MALKQLLQLPQRTRTCSGQRQVRMISLLFRRKTNLSQCRINNRRESRPVFPAIHARPEDSCPLRVGEKANPCEIDVERPGLNRSEGGLYFLTALFAGRPNELQFDVKAFHTGPAGLRG